MCSNHTLQNLLKLYISDTRSMQYKEHAACYIFFELLGIGNLLGLNDVTGGYNISQRRKQESMTQGRLLKMLWKSMIWTCAGGHARI